jgi:hypothetical protein
MKRQIRIFDLSKSEQRVVLIIIFALIAGAFAAYERRAHRPPVKPIKVTAPQPSPSPPSHEDAQ